MKKFLLLAAVAVAMTGSAFAQQGGDGTPAAFCANCPDQSTTSSNITAEADVAVPLQNFVVDNNICFGCLLRNQTVTINSAVDDNGAATPNTHSFASGSVTNIGNRALVEFAGDAGDLITMNTIPAGPIVMNWVPGPSSQIPVGGQSITMNMTPNAYAVADGGAQGSYNLVTSPAIALSNGPDANASTILGEASFNPTGLGVGEIDLYLGGAVTAHIDQQRGHYRGTFKVKANYLN